MSEPVYLVDVFRDLVASVSAKLTVQLQAAEKAVTGLDSLITGVHYEYGHYTDIQARLADKGKTAKTDKYPLVCLFEDYKVQHGTEGLTGITDLKLIILGISKAALTREQREAQVMRPIVYPIYFELLRQIKISGKFNVYDETKIPHEEIPRPHWGDPGLYRNESYLFGDVLDGVEINNLKLETYLDNCL